MRKQNLVNLVKYHVENNNSAFVSEVVEIAEEFDKAGEEAIAQYLIELISNAHYSVPQINYRNYKFLNRVEYSTKPLYLPECIEEEILGITKAINKKLGMSKFLFWGAPGSGKTESAYQIARLLERDILSVNMEQLIDSKLGETSKNIVSLFEEISGLPFDSAIVLFDELDAIVMDRVNHNDLREMGRVTSTFLREIDKLNENIVIIATTNLIANFDKAMLRRFDAQVSFDRYSKKELIEVAELFLNNTLKKVRNSKKNMRLFKKMLENLNTVPYPGEMKQFIRTAVAFSDENNEYDYLRKLYGILYGSTENIDIKELSREGYTTREIEILTRIPRSSVSRKLR